ncbi:hypothetical protein DSO57_1034248 [Entomophthora muscae]|uniref:Uncharacterized protein n=1 Tax=Entomophthora muscae TaxID=34485 RepID=A0ACC2UKQ1_9FUNG|nr:hypothetical protein DSO57_1034248 [Entomophthora muscae]
MVFVNKFFDNTSEQDSINRGVVQYVKAPVYTQIFDVGNKEADLYLTSNPYGFEFFSSHLVSSSAPALFPDPTPGANQPTQILSIDNSFPLETQAQEWDSNPDPGFLQAASPMDQGPACPRFPETEPLQAEAPAKSQSQNISAGLTIMMPKEELLKLPNEGRESSSVNFMNLKSSCVTNQIQLPKENTGFRPNPVTTAQNQEN